MSHRKRGRASAIVDCLTLSKVGLIRRATARWFSKVSGRHKSASPPAIRSQLANAEFSLTAEQVRRLIVAAPCSRDRALIRLLAETGLRRHEAAQLNVGDVDLEKRLVIVRNGKGNKLRVVPITTQLAVELGDLVSTSRSGAVFVSRQVRQLSLRQINRIVARAGKTASIHHPNPKYREITCHLLRHTFARLWKAHGGSIESLSKILGHSSVKTTWDVYGTESLADIRRNYDATMKLWNDSND
jgi:integrase